MKKRYFYTISATFVLLLVSPLMAQVGIDNTSPKGALHISSLNGGLIYPKLVLTDTNTETISNPNPIPGGIVAGTTVYNTTTSGSGSATVYPGLYIWDGTQWIPQFDKKDNYLFSQNSDLRTGDAEGAQSISFDNNSFTAQYNGTYRIQLTVHFGGGKLDAPNETNQWTNFNSQQGEFEFTFNRIPATNYTFNLKSLSGNNGDKLFAGTGFYEYYNRFNQHQYVIEEANLVAGTTYSFSLTFDQTSSPGFVSNGNLSTDGSGYITLNNGIRCRVEINYVGN